MHEQTGCGALAAARLAHHTERFALEDLEVDAVDRSHHCGLSIHTLALEREMLDQTAHRQQRLRRPARIRELLGGGAHCLTSMAERRPSDNMLKEIEVMKIITPGKAAIQGWV